VKDQDSVGALDGREAVGDDQGGPIPHELVGCGLDLCLHLRIHGAGGLVQDEDGRIESQGPGEGEELAFSDGQE